MARSVFFAATLAVLSAGCAGSPIKADSLQDPGALLFNGYSNPAANCYRCHGGDGSGVFLHGPNLASRVPSMTDDEIRDVIRHGQGHMPAFGEKLSASEVATLVSWLKQSFPPPVVPKT